jgi:hypothetical protein
MSPPIDRNAGGTTMRPFRLGDHFVPPEGLAPVIARLART